jgi:hypothetical protein
MTQTATVKKTPEGIVDIFDSLGTPKLNCLEDHKEADERLSWLNLTGAVKTGKSEFCANLQKHARVAHVDLEDGTAALKGRFWKASNMQEFYEVYEKLKRYKHKLNLDFLVIDPLDELNLMMMNDIAERQGVRYIGEIPMGRGWYLHRQEFKELINKLKALTRTLITVTHVKINSPEDGFTHIDMDIPGKVKQFVQTNSDAHALFTRQTKDGKSQLAVNFDTAAVQKYSFGGCRIKKMYDIKTADGLQKFLVNQISK